MTIKLLPCALVALGLLARAEEAGGEQRRGQ